VKILILNWKSPTDSTAGGAERYVLEVATRWADDGHEVTIFGPRPLANAPPLRGSSLNLRYVGGGSRLTVFHAADRYLRTSGAGFDWVLESVSTRPFAAHQIVGHKAVALYHQTAEEVWRMQFPFPISWLGEHVLEPRWIRTMRHARVVAVSPSTAAALRRFDVNIEGVVPPGCDPIRTATKRIAPGSTPRLIWLGRLVRAKRPNDAIAAFARVREVIPGATLDLVGGGCLEAPIRARHQPDVTVHGFVPEVVKTSLLSQADLLLLPGTREGWGLVAMEAASYGVPVVAYDIPGLRDAVLDGVTGMVVPAHPDALGAAAASLLQDPDRWRQLSGAAQQRSQEFTWDRAAEGLLRAFTRSTTPGVGSLSPNNHAPQLCTRAPRLPLSLTKEHPNHTFEGAAGPAVDEKIGRTDCYRSRALPFLLALCPRGSRSTDLGARRDGSRLGPCALVRHNWDRPPAPVCGVR